MRSLYRGGTQLFAPHHQHHAKGRLLRSSSSSAAVAAEEVVSQGLSFDLSESQREFQKLARDFTRDVIIPQAAKYDETMKFPQDIFAQAWELGLINTRIPERYGGLGLQCLDSVVINEEIAYGCTGMQIAFEINSLSSMPLIRGGNEEQKKKYLGRLVDAPIQAAYCVTEPNAGSDVAAVRTSAVKKGNDYVLNGTKMWITNAGRANWFFVLAKTNPELGHRGLTGFIVDADTPGISLGKKEINLGQRCSDTRSVIFEDVVVPESNRLGAEGSGFKLVMGAFDNTRPAVSIAAVGLARRAMDEAMKYATERKTMGKPLKDHQAIAFLIADMAMGIEMNRLVTYKAAHEIDKGRRNTLWASMAKAGAADHCNKVCYDAIQVFGGMGFSTESPVEKLYRDARILSIYGGTSQIQRLVVSRESFANPASLIP